MKKKRKKRERSIDCAAFCAAIVQEFPAMKEELDRDSGVYMFAHAFVDFTNDTIRRGDFETVKKCYALVDHLFRHGDSEVMNVISVGYIEHLAVFQSDGPNGIRAKCLMTATMLAQWKELEAYWMDMGKKRKK